MKPLLIGQAPGKKTDPERPLNSDTDSGYRLRRYARLSRCEYDELFDKINLINEFPGKDPACKGDIFPLSEATEMANRIRPTLAGRRVVFVGRHVARAFGHFKTKFFVPFQEHGYWCTIVPHPSGTNIMLNDPFVQDRVGEVLQNALQSENWSGRTEQLPTDVAAASMGSAA